MSNKLTELPALTSDQGLVYLSSLELGTDTIAHIAKKSGVPRSTCYLIVEELMEKGLLSEIKKGSKTYVTAEDPSKLEQLINSEKVQFDNSLKQINILLPQLKAIQNTRKDKPSVRFYEGLEGVKTIYSDTLNANEILVVCSGYDNPDKENLSNYLEKYFEEVDSIKIKTFEILGEAPNLESYIKKYQSDLHKIKKTSWGKGLKHTDKLIYGNKVVIIDNDNLTGMVIENIDIAELERKQFFEIWEKL
jgi:sugar-specific transcriptional regulator TrmB